MTVTSSTTTPRPAESKIPAGPAPVRRSRPDLLPYLLIAPVMIFIACLALVPAVFTVVQSFFKVDALDPPTRFDGFGNFVRLAKDHAVVGSIGNTALYVVIGVTLSTLIGIGAAVVLQKPFRGRSLVIAVLILPWAMPGVVEGILWTGIFDPNAGLINSVLSSLHLSDGDAVLLGQNRLLTIALIELVQVWQIAPLSVLLILAVLQLIPGELYEAAQIDGCTPWSAFTRITLPLARPGIAVTMVQAVIATLNVFDQPYVLNGAANTGASVTMQTYFISFQDLDFGQGYALSLLITIVTLLISLVVVRLVYRRVEL
ncbi:carbohydrate ABC transporter membrane protein 1 (CUT1 family) [Kribbella rubisoli]|uniref:Carbohydrate ABC transporter membrane protein 1 (CUT1 family) n=1 Tax=Kribbella rubisoli TaxID=3075929 RepID=A0A4Q7VZS2_9ACTN|nr:sugar ABC transporter permease [Kribbella rubisoli]RZU01859.1 carbohydrate ABC transporter membrane protein 1 (CUT1 family) [Kribbella rubisoli]